MVCNNCGKTVDEGQEYCSACGASVEEPIVLKVTKEDLKNISKKERRLTAEGPFINLEGYAKSLTANVTNPMALAGAVLIYLSPFMTWLVRDDRNGRLKGSLFDIGGKTFELALRQGILVACAILLLLVGVLMLLWSARENIRPLRPLADYTILRLLPAALGILIYVIILCNNKYSAACDVADASRGTGPVFCVAGLIIYIMSVVLDEGNRKN